MVIIRCTHKLQKLLKLPLIAQPPAPGNRLGDWYANLIPTRAGDLIIFASETTLLSVAIPAGQVAEPFALFVARVYNLLRMLDIPEPAVQTELSWYRELGFARTASRRVLGALNEITLGYQNFAVRQAGKGPPSLSEAELELSRLLLSPLKYQHPAVVARALLLGDSDNAAAGPHQT